MKNEIIILIIAMCILLIIITQIKQQNQIDELYGFSVEDNVSNQQLHEDNDNILEGGLE